MSKGLRYQISLKGNIHILGHYLSVDTPNTNI